MNDEEKKIQTALGTLYPFSMLMLSGQWYTVYSSDSKKIDDWKALLDQKMSLGTITTLPCVGDLLINPKNIIMFKRGLPESETKPKEVQ